MSTTTPHDGMVEARVRQLIRKEKPGPGPKPPARPPSSGVRVPGGSASPAMICPGQDRKFSASPDPGAVDPGLAAAAVPAVDDTVMESPVHKTLRRPSPLGGKSIHLQIVEGDQKGQAFDITGLGTYVIGRRGCDIVVDDEKVSRKHAAIIIAREGVYAAQDLASRNGTFVNGVRLTRRNIEHNDLIRVGNTTFRFTVFDGPVALEK